MINQVAIFGSGPAGLAAAHAAYLNGAWVTIFSRKQKSQIHGCQYLHAALPEMPDVMKTTVRYELQGTPDSYREKVYGPEYDGKVSVDSLTGQHDAWDLRATYEWLWDNYVDRPRGRCVHYNVDIKPQNVLDNDAFGMGFDRIMSTIPAPALCLAPRHHDFLAQDVWAIGDTHDPLTGAVEWRAPFTVSDDTVICCGEDSPSWYRAARVFGVSTVEWPISTKPPIPGVVRVSKPLWTDCDCLPGILRAGRYGAWDKQQLTHHAFEQMNEVFQ